MAAPSPSLSTRNRVTLRCYLHNESVTFENVKEFTEKRWNRFKSCAKEWLQLAGIDRTIAENLRSQGLLTSESEARPSLTYVEASAKCPDLGFHETCYRRFIDVKRITAQKRKQHESDQSLTVPSPKKLRLRSSRTSATSASSTRPVLPHHCIICHRVERCITHRGKRVKDRLCQAETFDAGLLRHAATQKKDENVLMHIRDKDCVAIEVRYHRSCYRAYTRHHREEGAKPDGSTPQGDHEKTYEAFCSSIVQQRLIDNQEIMRMTKLTNLFIKMIETHEGVNLPLYRKDQLKYRLQRDYPQLCFHRPSQRNVCEFVYDASLTAGDMAELADPSEESSIGSSEAESDTVEAPSPTFPEQDSIRALFNAGMIIRKAVKESPGMTCSWPPTAKNLTIVSAAEMVPPQLFNLIAWCTGTSEEPLLTEYVEVSDDSYVRLMSLCQDIIYLAGNGRKQTPKSLCLGLTVRHLTGSSQLVTLLNKFGHCASWDTVIGLETSLAQLQLATSHLAPAGFSKDTPTILVWDNIDFGEETVSGRGTTHHTNGIMIQSRISQQQQQERPAVKKGSRSLEPVVTELEPYASRGRKGPVYQCDRSVLDKSQYDRVMSKATAKDLLFLLSKFLFGNSSTPGWTGHNIQHQQEEVLPKSAIHYLPVIEAPPTEMTTINAILQKSISIADQLHLPHIVLVFDQAIYAKIQEIRWTREDLAKRTVVRLGEFHICMSFMGVIGKRFGDAGLRDILIESGTVAQGSINGVISGHHYNRAIHSHKIMFQALGKLRFSVFLENLTDEERAKYPSILQSTPNVQELFSASPEELADLMSCYDAFIRERNQESPTFRLWSSYLDMVQLLLVFIRATRESDWDLHLSAVRSMIPWFFAYDRMNYSRYLPAYWLEMVTLPSKNPKCFEEISKRGGWTVQRQDQHPFSSIACDQAIEQTCNRDSKTRGGITSLTLNRGAVQRWILSQPERSAIARQCEVMSGIDEHGRKSKELDQARIKRDGDATAAVLSTVEAMIDPFNHIAEDMVCLSSGVVANDDVVADLTDALQRGEAAAVRFMEHRLIENKEDIFTPIKQNKLKTFSENLRSGKKVTRDTVIKQDRKFFARLLIVGQKRKIDLREVLSYSLGSISFPLANASGSLAKTNKAALLHAVEESSADAVVRELPSEAALMIDGMAHVQSMRVIPETFGGLSQAVLSQICGLALKNSCSRVDFVADRYNSISIKGTERAKRAEGGSQTFKIYHKDQKTPRQFKKFLSNGDNKEALLEFMYNNWRETEEDLHNLTVFSTSGENCQRMQMNDQKLEVSPCPELSCDHEEADTRLLLHAKHAASTHADVVIKSPDTDVAVISLSHIDDFPGSALYFMTGKGNQSRIIDLKKASSSLSVPSRCLIGLHAFTGCDSTSAFYGKGKQKALKMLEDNPGFHNTFCSLGGAFNLDEDLLASLERFVCMLYGQTTTSINDVRYRVFCSSPSSEQSLPPTRDALIQHAKRSNYQAAIHRRALQQRMNAPSPDGHGWTMKDGELAICWMTRPPAPDVLLECVSCGCAVGKCLKGRCSCLNSGLPCTDICKCTNCGNFEEEAALALDEDNCYDEL